jgi:hypothetical protein
MKKIWKFLMQSPVGIQWHRVRVGSSATAARSLSGIIALLFSTLACQPVIAVGWNEFLIVFILFAVLLGPLIYRLLRRIEDFLKRRR